MTAPVSVIIATHDRPQMLEVALHSVLASAAMLGEPVRVLVVDDASETREAELVADRCRVDYVRNVVNLGVAGTLARGWALTDSELTCFWADDDAMMPRHLPVHVAKIREGHDAVYANYHLCDHNLRMGRAVHLPPVTHRDLLRGQCNATDVALMRRSSVEAIGGWRPQFERAMLLDHWLRATRAGWSIATVREATWLYRRHESQLSHLRPNEHDQALRDAAIAEHRTVAA